MYIKYKKSTPVGSYRPNTYNIKNWIITAESSCDQRLTLSDECVNLLHYYSTSPLGVAE